MTIVAREKEIERLQEVLLSPRAEFIAAYGRRRVGKTYLIREFFRDKGLYIELTGRKGANKSEQLKNALTIVSEAFPGKIKDKSFSSWDDALTVLRKHVEEHQSKEKIILFFDELPWLASKRSGFMETLDYCWNRYFSSMKNIILIVAGSAAEWMIKKIVSNKAGLHNRLTRPPINLLPFTLSETEKYLNENHIFLDRKQIIDIYMAVGGVAYYLNLIPRGKSSAEIISSLFFSGNAPLMNEFHILFDSLFDNAHHHRSIIDLLAKKQIGLSQSEIINGIPTLSSGGGTVTVLEELEHCGFIMRIQEFGKKKKEARYRLVDAYTLFYLKWVQGKREASEHYWLRERGSSQYQTWSGYAFENICLLHYREILKSLQLTVIADVKNSWRFLPEKGALKKGTQIDLIIDRADKCINLCEIKFYDHDFIVNKSVMENIKNKKMCFKEMTKTRKTLFITLISPYGAKKDANYFACIDNELTMDDLF